MILEYRIGRLDSFLEEEPDRIEEERRKYGISGQMAVIDAQVLEHAHIGEGHRHDRYDDRIPDIGVSDLSKDSIDDLYDKEREQEPYRQVVQVAVTDKRLEADLRQRQDPVSDPVQLHPLITYDSITDESARRLDDNAAEEGDIKTLEELGITRHVIRVPLLEIPRQHQEQRHMASIYTVLQPLPGYHKMTEHHQEDPDPLGHINISDPRVQFRFHLRIHFTTNLYLDTA